MEKVLATPELLEAILLQLDPRTLLTTAQRVSKPWHDIIHTAPSLQKALFLAPDTGAPHANSASAPTPNPFLAEWFPALFASPPGAPAISSDDFAEEPFARRADVLLRRGASWRRMHVARPPVARLGSFSHIHAMINDLTDAQRLPPPGPRIIPGTTDQRVDEGDEEDKEKEKAKAQGVGLPRDGKVETSAGTNSGSDPDAGAPRWWRLGQLYDFLVDQLDGDKGGTDVRVLWGGPPPAGGDAMANHGRGESESMREQLHGMFAGEDRVSVVLQFFSTASCVVIDRPPVSDFRKAFMFPLGAGEALAAETEREWQEYCARQAASASG